MPEVRVQPRSIYEHHLHIKKSNTTLNWSFSTKKNSIYFGLYFKPDEAQPNHRASMDGALYPPSSPINPLDKSRIRNLSLPKITQLRPHNNNLTKQSPEDNLPLSPTLTRANFYSDKEDERHCNQDNELHLLIQDSSQSHIAANQRKLSSATSITNLLENDFVELIPIEQVNSSKEVIAGSFLAQKSGSYVLLFDNMFSRTTPKLLTFTVTTDEPLEEASSEDIDISGWMLKKRRKRMQGWAKRWFELSSTGVLSYSVRKNDIKRGSLQIGLATMVISAKQRTIHLDSGTTTFHLKATSADSFEQWLAHISARRSLVSSVNSSQGPVIWTSDNNKFQPLSSLGSDLVSKPEQKQDHEDSHLIISKSLVDFDTQIRSLKQLLFEDLNIFFPNETAYHANSSNFLREDETPPTSPLPTAESSVKRVRTPLAQSLFSSQLDEIQTSTTLTTSQQEYFARAISTSIKSLEECRDTLSDAFHRCFSYQQEQDDIVNIGPLEFSSGAVASILPHRSIKSFYSYSIQSDQYYDAEDFFMSTDDNMSQDLNGTDSEDRGDEQEHENFENPKQATNQCSLVPLGDKKGLEVTRRDRLPHPVAVKNISFLSILRKNIGKDLSTITMPITLNEPINLLQHLCEELDYADLIERAALQSSSIDRLMYIILFAVSGYASSQYRIGRKPFNPLLYETYECVRPDKGFRFISEKVSHHPNILACHADSDTFEYSQNYSGKTKFWGKSMELIPEGQCCISLKEHNDFFTYSRPSSWLRNLVAGTKYIEHIGEIKVVNHTTGDYGLVEFKEATTPGTGFFSNLASNNSQYRNHVTAKIYNKDDILIKELQGKWNESMSEVLGPDQHSTLWRCKPPNIPDHDDYYGFTSFLMELNEITTLERNKLPDTDTRYRPDQRLFEEGKLSEAEIVKEQVEQMQRERRRRCEMSGETHQPLWFELKEDKFSPEGKSWKYKGGYWEARASGQWPKEMIALW